MYLYYVLAKKIGNPVSKNTFIITLKENIENNLMYQLQALVLAQ